jgi:glycosyltransferase involved in cell wall biosynthesis
VNLAINGWRAQGNLTGVPRYLLNVVRRWTPERLAAHGFDATTFYTGHRADRGELRVPDNIALRMLLSDRPMLVWENTRFARAAGEDVAFHPSFSIPFWRRGKTVVTTHEIIAVLHPDHFPANQRYYNQLYRWSALNATRVITDSEIARDDIVREWGVAPEKIRAVRLAPDDVFGPRDGDPAVHDAHVRYVGDETPFFLSVGKLGGRRNVPLLLEAYAEYVRRCGDGRTPNRLVLIGKDTQGIGIPERTRELGLTEHLVHHTFISDEDLILLYNAAQVYVTPAVYEPVSLPVPEAQKSGTPILAFDNEGLRELTGDSAVLVPRIDARSMAEGMERIAGDEALRARLSEEGMRRVAPFTWERTAEEHLEVLAEAARSR